MGLNWGNRGPILGGGLCTEAMQQAARVHSEEVSRIRGSILYQRPHGIQCEIVYMGPYDHTERASRTVTTRRAKREEGKESLEGAAQSVPGATGWCHGMTGAPSNRHSQSRIRQKIKVSQTPHRPCENTHGVFGGGWGGGPPKPSTILTVC